MDVFAITDRGVTYRIQEVEEGGYFGEVLAFRAASLKRPRLNEMVENLREALAVYLEVAEEDGVEIPQQFRQAVAAAS